MVFAHFTPTSSSFNNLFPDDLFKAIKELKQELNAVILAHYYQEPDIQDIADYIGDSLGLSQQAASTNAESSCLQEFILWRKPLRF
jgi:quinolinate synthase